MASKKIMKKVLSLLLSVGMCLQASAVVSAVETPTVSGETQGIDLHNGNLLEADCEVITEAEEAKIETILEQDYDAASENGVISVYDEKSSKYNFSSSYYYDQLTSDQKYAYNSIKTACEEFLISDADMSTAFFSYVTVPALPSEESMEQVYWLFYFSNPQYFFLRNSVSISSDYDTFYLKTYDICQSASSKATIRNKIDSLTDSWMSEINAISNTVDKEVAIAKKLSDNITYVSDSNYNQSLIGSLYYGKCVCTGYAMAMNYFCNAAGIECITVTSVSHAWNRVRLYGNWYEACVTNYDQGSYYWDDVLNKSTSHMVSVNSMYIIDTSNTTYSGIVLPSCVYDDVAVPENRTPKLMVSPLVNGMSLSWESVPGADQYYVFFYDTDFHPLAFTSDTNYTVQYLNGGQTYGFLVLAGVNGQWSSWTMDDVVYGTALKENQTPKLTASPLVNGMYLSWEPVYGADQYYVFFYDTDFHPLAFTSDTNYTVQYLNGGQTYGFLVLARVNGQWSSWTMDDVVYGTALKENQTPKLTASPLVNGMSLSWESVPGADQYYVFFYDTDFHPLAYTSDTNYTVQYLNGGQTYGFLVLAGVNGQWSSWTMNDVVYGTALKENQTPKLTASPLVNGMYLSWESVPGADQYYVFFYDTDFHPLAFTSDTNYTVQYLNGGQTYGFLVLAGVNGQWSSWTMNDVVYGTALKENQTPKLTASPLVNGMYLSWEPVYGADQYYVFFYDTDFHPLAFTSDTNYTVQYLNGGQTYGFLVLARVNGQWSSWTMDDVVYGTAG